MKEKRFLDRLPVKERVRVLRVRGIYDGTISAVEDWRAPNVEQTPMDPAGRLRWELERMGRRKIRTAQGLRTCEKRELWQALRGVAYAVRESAMAERLLEENPTALARGLYTAGRIDYLSWLIHPEDPLNEKAPPWFELFGAFTICDEPLIAAYERMASAHFKEAPRSLWDVLMDLWHGRRDSNVEHVAWLAERAPWRPKLYEDLRTALLAVAEGRWDAAAGSIDGMTASHRRQAQMLTFHDGLYRWISVPAHAMRRLAIRCGMEEATCRPTGLAFDEGLETVIASGHCTEGYVDVGAVSATIQGWMDALPADIDATRASINSAV